MGDIPACPLPPGVGAVGGGVSIEIRSESVRCHLIGMHPQFRFIVLVLMTGLSQ